MSNDPLLNVSQAARLLGVSRGTLYNWVYEGRIDHVKLGPSALRFLQSKIEKYVSQHERKARHA